MLWSSFGSEFGRLPTSQGLITTTSRAILCFLLAQVLKGLSYSATDEIGMAAVEGRMHMETISSTPLLAHWAFFISG